MPIETCSISINQSYNKERVFPLLTHPKSQPIFDHFKKGSNSIDFSYIEDVLILFIGSMKCYYDWVILCFLLSLKLGTGP